MSELSADLVQAFFPGIQFKRPVQGYETLMSIDKARHILGYEPQYTWRNVLAENGNLKSEPYLYAMANV